VGACASQVAFVTDAKARGGTGLCALGQGPRAKELTPAGRTHASAAACAALGWPGGMPRGTRGGQRAGRPVQADYGGMAVGVVNRSRAQALLLACSRGPRGQCFLGHYHLSPYRIIAFHHRAARPLVAALPTPTHSAPTWASAQKGWPQGPCRLGCKVASPLAAATLGVPACLQALLSCHPTLGVPACPQALLSCRQMPLPPHPVCACLPPGAALQPGVGAEGRAAAQAAALHPQGQRGGNVQTGVCVCVCVLGCMSTL